MKKKIHPKYHHDTKVTCTCGNSFVTGSVEDKIQVEICASCHPFFTGEMRYVDTLGRVEKFQKRRQAALKKANVKKSKKSDDVQDDQQPKTLKQMLQGVKAQQKSDKKKTDKKKKSAKSSKKDNKKSSKSSN